MMIRKLFFATIVAGGLSGLGAAEFSRLEIGEVPAGKEFLGEMVLTRAKERTAFSDGGDTLKVSFRLDPKLEGEKYAVETKGGQSLVAAGRVRGLIYGAGALLRSVEWGERSFKVADGVKSGCPVKPIRCAYWARHFYNWYHMASTDELVRYAEDLALWGINTINYQFVYPAVDFEYSRPGDVERFERVSRELAKALAVRDIDIIAKGGNNQAPFDTDPKLRGEPNVDPKRGNNGFNVCPAKPGGMEFLLKQQRTALAKYEGVKLDWLFHWPFDEGGCECEKCRPWGGNGFLKMCKQLAAQNKAMRPEIRTLLCTWTFHDDEFEMLWKYLGTADSKWIDGLIIDSHGDFPKYPLEHKLPREVSIITFPEISMWGREPWGGFGAIAMPSRFERLFRQCEKVVSGYMFYSEGLFEDINKVTVTQLYVDPSRNWRDIVREYCRYELPGVDPDKFLELVVHLENGQVLPNFEKRSPTVANVGRGDIPHFNDFEGRCRYCLEEAEKAEKLAAEIEKSMSPSRRANWRWRQIRLRTIIDLSVNTERKWNTPIADKAYEELVRLYHADRTYGCIRSPIPYK